MQRCAFLTLEEPLDFYIYDRLLVEPFAQHGWEVSEVPWSRPGMDWSAFDAVIVRSTWDYQNHLPTFLRTLEAIEAKTRLFNSLATCRWNSNKRYLADLEQRGVPIVPTRWPERLDAAQIEAGFQHFGVERLVVKPLVGANADNAFVLHRGDAASWNEAMRVYHDQPLIMQPFLERICDEGEFSLFYFGGEFSHAICKRPAAGDFRVQEEHGGQIIPWEPSAALRVAGDQALAALNETLLYARVDLVSHEGGWRLMEMELIEPSLYFEQCEQAPERFTREFLKLTRAQ